MTNTFFNENVEEKRCLLQSTTFLNFDTPLKKNSFSGTGSHRFKQISYITLIFSVKWLTFAFLSKSWTKYFVQTFSTFISHPILQNNLMSLTGHPYTFKEDVENRKIWTLGFNFWWNDHDGSAKVTCITPMYNTIQNRLTFQVEQLFVCFHIHMFIYFFVLWL